MESPSVPLSAPLILIVDDDALIQELINIRLCQAGYRTERANDGQQALSRLRDHLPDAMILDLSMPRLDGFGVLEQMKRLGLLARVPTMVLTARNQAGEVMEAIQLGARDFLTKPFEDPMLLSRVARLVRKVPEAPAGPPSRTPSQLLW